MIKLKNLLKETKSNSKLLAFAFRDIDNILKSADKNSETVDVKKLVEILRHNLEVIKSNINID